MTKTRILAAVADLPKDDAVLARALEIAAARDATLTIVHVLECEATPAGQAGQATRDAIGAALDRLGRGRVICDIRIEAGSAPACLIDLCDTLAPDLVVMRAHQRKGIAEKILGSTTDRVIAAIRQSVLIVKRAPGLPYGVVLVATDGTDDPEGSLACVAHILPDAALHLVQVVRIVPQQEEAMLRTGTDQAGLRAQRNALARAANQQLSTVASRFGRKLATHVLRGDPAAALIRASRLAKVDLIAAGPGHTSLIRRAFVGSVTRRLVQDAACDILITRPNG
ncbi:universal stress protein [Oceaniglobus indicus]|uniref:universal stress protein n=1 Tax=Oceaniglobus indicus TaxID=2047749 RepID=UPI000C17BF30|nr:universal stress protein [Oceaniglobus indicus]